jgi:hypothetical protein
MKNIAFKGIPLFPNLDAIVEADPPTERQINILYRFGLEAPETKDEATRIISSELEYRQNRGWREEGDDPQNADDVIRWED